MYEVDAAAKLGPIAMLGYRLNECARRLSVFLGIVPHKGRHPWTVFVLGAVTWLVMVLGPSFWYFQEPGTHRKWPIYLIAFLGATLLFLPIRYPTVRILRKDRDTLFIIHAVVAIAFGIYFASGWFTSVWEYSAGSGYVFRHVYMAVFGTLFVLLIVHRLFCVGPHIRITGFEKLSDRLEKADLMVDVKVPGDTVQKHPVRVLISAPTRHLYLYAVMNSLAVVLFATWLPTIASYWILLGAAVVFGILFSFGFYHRHWDLVAGIILRRFALGTPGIVSLGVLILGAGQLFSVDYITTIINGSPVASLLASGYAVFWLYEYLSIL